MLLLPFTFLLVPFVLATASHRKLVDLATAGNGVIKLDANTYDLVTAPNRNWSIAIQLTALDPQRRCGPCREFDPTWKAVAAAWTKVPKEYRNDHFFATLDFEKGHTVFQKLGLSSAPVVYVHPPTEGPRVPADGKTAPSKYEFPHGFEAKPLAEYISKHTPVPIPYKEPIDWGHYITIAIPFMSILLVLRYIVPVLQNRWVWAVITILTCLVMTSGFMFTRIRNSPYTGGNGNWVAAGYSNQFGQEVHVLAFIYGLLAVAFIMLIVIIPNQVSPNRQRIQIYLWTAVIMIVYSILVSLFKVKNRGYPFKLFL